MFTFREYYFSDVTEDCFVYIFCSKSFRENVTSMSQIQKRIRVADLLRAHVTYTEITRITGASSQTISAVKKQIEAGGDLQRKPRSVKNQGKTKILDDTFLDKLEAWFEDKPDYSIRRTAKEMGVDEKTIRNGLNILGMSSVSRPSRQLLTEKTKETRLFKAKRLLYQLKKQKPGTVRVFSDKKFFTVDQVHNKRNDRMVVKKGTKPKPIMKTKFPAKVMVLGIVASDGNKCPPIFIKEGLKVTASVYIGLLRDHVLPWLKATYPEGNYVFQQDSAPGHKAKTTQAWMKKHLAHYWPWTIWPPSSPCLNPLDYAIWGVLGAKVGATSHRSLEVLKAKIMEEWAALSADFIRKSCRSFRRRIEATIEAEGGHIE